MGFVCVFVFVDVLRDFHFILLNFRAARTADAMPVTSGERKAAAASEQLPESTATVFGIADAHTFIVHMDAPADVDTSATRQPCRLQLLH